MNEIVSDERRILMPFDKRECITLRQAADIAGKSESTMRGRCEERGLGRRVGGGSWMVSKVALAMFLDGDLKALKAYHAGNRTEPTVIAYFRRVGLGDLIKA
jgi:predicted transcriptional regulator of viral defense system